ncbi:MAG TPA: AAA family ATPase [Lentisphaeria bacterium]|nr:MAG: AAA family ATPase [Lentisphaerae bacterium GWF2_49_21]HBC86337.1 AAA family ATPase [Lentisphaeria bacterium]
MSLEAVRKLLKQKENIRLEFKTAGRDLPENLFESICAMLNRDGGDIILGVDDKGVMIGVPPDRVEVFKTNLVNLSNNPQKLDPPFILFPLGYEIGGRAIIHIQVPASSQVHKTGNTVYDRGNDGDFRVVQPHRIAEIYNRKRTHYTEGIIYPSLRFEDFKAELFPKIRNLIQSNNPNHPWLALDDRQMLVMAGLFKRDFQTGKEGYTLAAAILLGKDEIIQQLLPHYKIDALVRKVNHDRYDDREYIQTNLVDAYDKLMDFTAKHLPDRFFMEGEQRVSLRSKIFREVAANLIIHREYTNALPATLIIYNDRVETKNANNPHGEGPISQNSFAPFPKNPAISKFFIQLGRAEEIGSGIYNIGRYLPHYSPGKKAVFVEGPVFNTIIPLPDAVPVQDTMQDTVQDTMQDKCLKLLVICVGDMSRGELQRAMRLKNRDNFRKEYLNSSIERGLLALTIPDKPNSKKQKYRLTDKGRSLINKKE